MPKARRFTVQGYQGTDLSILTCIHFNGRYVLQSDIASILFNAKKSDGTIAGGGANTGSLSVGGTIYNALQMDDRWTLDAVGYNFLAIIPASAIPTSGQWDIDLKLTPHSGSAFWVPVQANLLSVTSLN